MDFLREIDNKTKGGIRTEYVTVLKTSRGQQMKINMDKTIVDMLKKYRAHIGTLIAREEKEIDKIKDNIDHELAQQDFLNLKRADDFLKLIVEDPKKYLYRDHSIKGTPVDANNQPCDWYSGAVTIADKLRAIHDLEDKYNIPHVIYSLSVYISSHVDVAGAKKPWVYDNRSIELNWRKNFDYNAMEILEWNKYVNLLSLSHFSRKFKEMIPARRFAIRQEKQR